jgi:hypothetical protein
MIIDNSGTGIASLGRDEDRFVAHVAPGERVVPPVISADTQARLSREMMAAGLDPDEYIVGPHMSINPITGQPEFGWFKKTFKSLKKVAKTVGPVAVNFIPGIGPLAKAALTAGIGKASGLSTKQALLGGALSYGGSKLFGGTPTGGSTPASTGSFFSRAKEFITPGADGVGIFGNVKEFVLPGQDKVGLFGNVKKGIGSLFGGPQVPEGLEIGADGMYVDAAGNTYDYQQLVDMGVMDRSGNIINTPQANLSNRGGFLDTVKNVIRPDQPGQSQLGLIEDMIKGRPSDPVRAGGGFLGGSPGQGGGGGMFGGNLGLMGLAGLAGKIAYDASKERMGGIAETPKVTMDQLGRYQMAQNLGTGGSRADFGLAPAPVALDFAYGGEARQYFNEGGLATMIDELDMREGGESEGPGTGTSDDIPAMLSDGEFVMTAKATRGAGAFDVNKTKSGIELIKGGSASREEGVKNMRELMNIFEAI